MTLRICFMICIGMAGVTMFLEEKFIFFPSLYPIGRWDLPKSVPISESRLLKIKDCWFEADDGIELHGWLCTKITGSERTVNPSPSAFITLWCHGNAGNITDRYEKLITMGKLSSDFFLFDYRGYGRSKGIPSEVGLYLDVEAAWNYLLEVCGYSPSQIIIYGNSLGGVPAIDLATKVPSAGLIVQSSFTSIRDMAASTMPFIPGFLIRTKMNSIDKISRVACPKLFIHSPADEVVPYKLGRRLFEAAKQPKEFYEVPNAGHNETYSVAGDNYISKFREFFELCKEKSDNR